MTDEEQIKELYIRYWQYMAVEKETGDYRGILPCEKKMAHGG